MSGFRCGAQVCPVREYDQSRPIRGRIVYADGSESMFTYARYVNGREREVVRVEIDGRRFVPAPDVDWDSEVCE